MSTKHVRTIGDVWRFKCGLKVSCRRCFNTRTFDGPSICSRLKNSQIGIAELQKRLRCSRCGARDADAVVLTPPPPR